MRQLNRVYTQRTNWDDLRHQVFLGGEGFAERHCAAAKPLERLREVPLASFAHRYPERGEAMARAFATGVYTMQEIAASTAPTRRRPRGPGVLEPRLGI